MSAVLIAAGKCAQVAQRALIAKNRTNKPTKVGSLHNNRRNHEKSIIYSRSHERRHNSH